MRHVLEARVKKLFTMSLVYKDIGLKHQKLHRNKIDE